MQAPHLRSSRRLLAVVFTVIAFAWPLRAQETELARAVKATYLYKFAPFVEWPETTFDSPESPLAICVLGDRAFASLVARAVAGQRMGRRHFAVLLPQTVEQAGDCHVLYVGTGERSVAQILAAVRARPVLTITDALYGAEGEGVVHLVMHEGRIRFVIDLRRAEEQGLTISSRVLELALRVVTP